MSTDRPVRSASGSLRRPATFACAAAWPAAYATTGRDLAGFAAAGRLRRGLRAVLTHHVIFAWNRTGLPHATQASLAAAASGVVSGCDPTRHHPENGGSACF
nr:lantibiotic dehydratase C-terminal domain-containing protein [Microtetraspora sp. NBRC 13810]